MDTLIILYVMACASYVFTVGFRCYKDQPMYNIDKVVMVVLFPAALVIIVQRVCRMLLEGVYSTFKGKSWFEEWK